MNITKLTLITELDEDNGKLVPKHAFEDEKVALQYASTLTNSVGVMEIPCTIKPRINVNNQILTLRDYIAIEMLRELIKNVDSYADEDIIANFAYGIADAMIKAKE